MDPTDVDIYSVRQYLASLLSSITDTPLGGLLPLHPDTILGGLTPTLGRFCRPWSTKLG